MPAFISSDDYDYDYDYEEEEEEEEEEDALSPTNGYFHASAAASSAHHFPAYYQPSIPRRDIQLPAAASASVTHFSHEITTPAGSASLGRTPPRNDHHHHHHHRNQPDVPPAYSYSPLPSSPLLLSPGSSSSRLYQTLVNTHNMGRPEEHEVLLSGQPQSIGDFLDEHPAASRGQRWKHSSTSRFPQFRSILKTLVGVAVLVSVFVTVFSNASFRRGVHRCLQTPKVIDLDPVREAYMGPHGELEWQPAGSCRDTPHKFEKKTSEITFDSGYSLKIKQGTERPGSRRGRNPSVFGTLHIRPSKESEESSTKGTVEIEIISNDEKLAAATSVNIDDDGGQSIKIITPHSLDWWGFHGQGPCVQIRVTVYAPQNGFVNKLSLDLVHLDVEFADGLAIGSIDGPVIHTVIGNVKTPRSENLETSVSPYTLQSRKITIQTVSGDVSGWFPLYDLLQVETASGSIDVQVAPKEADDKSPASATLSISSVSGNIKIAEPLDSEAKREKRDSAAAKAAPPARDYVVKVGTSSGDIEASVAVTSHAGFETVSGDAVLEVLPLLPKDSAKPGLRTETKSGKITLKVLDPIEIDLAEHLGRVQQGEATESPALSDLQTQHSSISGNLKLFFPGSWVGKFKAQSISGDITAKGKGLKITRSDRRITKTVEGEKGDDGSSFTSIHSVSGQIKLLVGEE